MSRIDEVGTRLVTVIDATGDNGLIAPSIQAVSASSQVAWTFGLGAVTDVRNLGLEDIGRAAPLRLLYGGLPPAMTLVDGRLPRHGEAVVGEAGATALGLRDGAGTVTDGSTAWPVVGVIRAQSPLTSLDDGVFVAAPADSSTQGLRYLYAMAKDVTEVEALSRALPALVYAKDPSRLEIDAPQGAIALREVVSGDLGAASRQMMALTLGVGLVLVGVTMFGAVVARRREFGRRRALGATRSTVVVIVLLQSSVAAVSGALIGCTVGLLVVHKQTGTTPDLPFVLALALLAVLLSAIASVPPAIAASLRDPVRILRVP